MTRATSGATYGPSRANSTIAPTTISGLSAGAKPMNQPCAGPWGFCAVPVFPAIVMVPPKRPAARAVGAVVVLRPCRELGRDFSRQVDARARVESDPVRLLEQRAEADLEAELIKKHVAALGDGVGEAQVAVPLRGP